MKKILASILVLCLVLSTMGTFVFAAEKVDVSSAVDGVITLESGTYTLSGLNGQTLTIKAAEGADVVFEMGSSQPNFNGADVTFEDITFNWDPASNYKGLQHSGDLKYNNCTINGKVFLYGESETFTGCTFNQEIADYNVWTYGAKYVKFDDCTFNCVGKSVLVYNEGAGATTLDVVDCDFIASAPSDGKAAIEISTYGGAAYVTIDEETTATGFGTGSVSGNSLWNNKDEIANPGQRTDSIVTVAGEVVYAEKGDGSTNVVAMVGTNLYASLDEAIAAANDGDTIDLMGNTVALAGTQQMDVKKDITITNGTIDITGIDIAGNAIWIVSSATLTFDEVNLIGDGYDSAFGVVYLVTTDAGVKFIDSTVDLNADGKSGGFVKGDGYMGTVLIDNSDINLVATNRGFISTDVTIQNDSHISISGNKSLEGYGIENAFNICGITLKDTSTIDIKDCYEYGIKVGDAAISIEDTAKVTATGSTIADIAHRSATNTGVITVAETASVMAEKVALNNEVAGDGDVISKADIVSVEFAYNEEASDDDEGYKVYDIKVIGANSEVINRLNTADLTFVLSESKIAYEITPADKITLTTDADYADRYMFNFKGKDDVADTEKEIVIGQVKFTGYDSFTFGVKDVATNLVTATTIRDNIVDEFKVANSTLVINEDTVTGDENIGSIDTEIVVPKRTLTVNVDFPNVVVDNAADYQAMTVTISGGDLAEDIVKNLGSGTNANASYTVTEELTLNTAYTVTVKGAGYRTARYTVTMTEAKTLNFWNNVKDNTVEVEEGEAGSAVIKNFLAGDIVADNVINIYDLSAAVSYFTELVSSNADYIKYDLNRDGVIDSKDVAYILVSWGE